MKRIILAALIAGAATMAQADPIHGVWKTEVDDGNYAHIKFGACGASICGTIARTFNNSGEFKSDRIGKALVWDMKPEGGGKYGSGKIWQPSTDKVFKSKMEMNGSTLRVSGCVGPICKKQTWTRVQ